MADPVPPKSIFQSKTMLFNFLVGIVAFIPGVSSWFVAHPDIILYGLVVGNMLLRFVTKNSINLFGSDT